MQIVIEIPDTIYEDITENFPLDSNVDYVLKCAVSEGTPLPKGHGRLIDEPTEEDIAKTIGGKNDFADCIRDSVKAVFDNAPTIIEAEPQESEGKE